MVTKHKISPRLDKEYKIKGEQLATPQLKKWFRQEVQKYRVLRENSDQQPTEQDLRDIFNGLPRFGKNSTASRYLVEEFAYDLEKIMHAPNQS